MGCMEERSYNQVVEACADRLYGFAYRLTRDADAAADLVQDAFLKLWEYEAEVKEPAAFLYAVLYRAFADAVRRGRLKRRYAAEVADGAALHAAAGQGDRAVERMEWRDCMTEALAGLPDVQRAVLLLRDYEGYNYAEIGEMTGLHESQVKVYLFRARVKLRMILKNRM